VQKLKPGGYIHVATDWQDYAEQVLRVLKRGTAAGEHRRRLRAPPRLPPAHQVRAATDYGLGHGVWDLVFRRKKDL